MDSFPDIRALSTDELMAYLAALSEAAEQNTIGHPAPSRYEAYVSDNLPTAYRQQVLNNKIELVRAELAGRGRRPDPGNG